MAHPDLEKVLDTLLEFTQQFLARTGTVPPFGVVLRMDGVPSFVAADFSRYSGMEMLDLVKKGIRECAAQPEVNAVGLCYDGNSTLPSSSTGTHAICVQLEHRQGDALLVNVSWSRGWFGRFKMGKRFTSPSEPQFFVDGVADHLHGTSELS